MFFLMRGTIGLRFPRLGISQAPAVLSGDADRFPLLDDCFVRSVPRVDTPTPYTRDFFYRRDRLVVRTVSARRPFFEVHGKDDALLNSLFDGRNILTAGQMLSGGK
jgi:hypothetical protein